MNIKEASQTKIHFFYVTLILTSIIIILTTYKWTEIKDFRDYLSVGATLTSLVLGLLAIIYSFISNGQQHGALGAIESAAGKTSHSVTKIDELMHTAEAIQSEAKIRSSELQKVAKDLTAAIEEVRKEASNVVLTNRDLASTIPSQFDNIRDIITSINRAPLNQTSNLNSAHTDDSVFEKYWTKEKVEEFLSDTSNYGLVMITAFCHGLKHEKNVSIDLLAENIGVETAADYLHGFIIGLQPTQLIEFHQPDGNTITIYPEAANLNLKAAIDNEWTRRESKSSSSRKRATNIKNLYKASHEALVDRPQISMY